MEDIDASFADELVLAMQDELERILNEKKRDVFISEGSAINPEHQKLKKAVIDILLLSVRMQRLYFVFRSAIMGLLSALVTLIIVGYLGTINMVQAVFLGIFLFLVSLFLSRLLDRQIIRMSQKIISLLNRHKRAKAFVLKNL